MVTQMALPISRWQKMVPTITPVAKKSSIPAWVASFFRWDLSGEWRWWNSLARPTPIWRIWLVVKVVATGMPSAWRKVLYCMEARKLMTTWQIWAGGGLGHKAQAQHGHHLDEHQDGVPPDGKAVFDGVGGQLGHHGAQHIGRDGYQIVQALAPLPGTQGQAHEDHVAGLGVAEYAAPQQEGVCAPEARHGDQGEVDPVPFTGEKMLLVLLFALRIQVSQPFPSPILWIPLYPRKRENDSRILHNI